MVQYRTNSRTSREYWKLRSRKEDDIASLQSRLDGQHGFGSKFRKDKGRLAYLCSRQDRGLLSYDRCESSELEQFCKDRKVYSTNPFHQHKMAYMYLLETLDERGVFHNLLQLPAELRLLIYEQHIEWLREQLKLGWGWGDGYNRSNEAYNFLTHLLWHNFCRLVRNEMLPLFYGSFRFLLSLDQVMYSCWLQPSDVRRSWFCSLRLNSNTLFCRPHLWQYISRIRINADFSSREKTRIPRGTFDSFDIDFSKRYKPRVQRRTSLNVFAASQNGTCDAQESAWDDIARRVEMLFTRRQRTAILDLQDNEALVRI